MPIKTRPEVVQVSQGLEERRTMLMALMSYVHVLDEDERLPSVRKLPLHWFLAEEESYLLLLAC